MKKLLLILGVLLITAPLSFAALENVKVSGGIITNGVVEDISLGSKLGTPDESNFLTLQGYLQINADLTENIFAAIRMLTEKNWGISTVASTDVDLDQCYVTLKEFVNENLTLVIGRQPLKYGSGLIVGDPDTNRDISEVQNSFFLTDLSLRKSFDAVKAVLDLAPLTVDLIYAKVDSGNTINVDDDTDLYGINLKYDVGKKNAILEAYFFAKRTGQQGKGNPSEKKDTVYCVGVRGQGDLNENLSLTGEIAYQFGDYQSASNVSKNNNRSAVGVQVGVNYNLEKAGVGLIYTYLSGDDRGTSTYEGWDPMFEDQSPGIIANLLFANTNSHVISLTGQTKLRDDVTLWGLYSHLILAEKISVSQISVNTIRGTNTYTYAVNTNEKDVGDELDFGLVYDYNEDVQFGLCTALFFPSDLFASSNDDVGYQVRGAVKVTF